LALWASGIREAKLLSLFTDEPKKVTRRQAERYAAAFDSWNRRSRRRFVLRRGTGRRADPCLHRGTSASSSAAPASPSWRGRRWHLKKEPDTTYLGWLPLIERHAGDGRNFVKKAVNWALRQIGKRSLSLHAPALELAQRLAASSDKAARWIGKDAVKELSDARTLERLAEKR